MGRVVLHSCGGHVRYSLPPDKFATARCIGKDCGAPIGPELPYVEGHAGYLCVHCQTLVGFCCAGLLEALLDDASHVLRGET